MNDAAYKRLRQRLALTAALVLAIVGIMYSANGFGFGVTQTQLSDSTTLIQLITYFLGVILGVLVTFIEIIWNGEALEANITFYFIGIITYSYGIWANYIGIRAISGDGGFDLFSIVIAIFIEVLPEMLLAFAITGQWRSGDILRNLLHATKVLGSIDGGSSNSNKFKQQKTNVQNSSPRRGPDALHPSNPRRSMYAAPQVVMDQEDLVEEDAPFYGFA